MRRSIPFALAATFAAGIPLFSWSMGAAHGQGAPTARTPAPAPEAAGALRAAPVAVLVKTDRKLYGPGDAIPITITVKNTSKQPVTLHFSSGQKYDLELRKGKDAKGPLVWQWSRGRMFAEMLQTVLLAPNKTLTFNESYKPSNKPDDNMPRLAPGSYLLTAIVTTMGSAPRPFGATPLTIK